MDSCFPPLAGLSLRDKKSPVTQKGHRHSTSNPQSCAVPKPAGKIEILQDLDLYYIRQIAHNLKEYDLEQKIELEIKMREGTTKLLQACNALSRGGHHADTQLLEAAKNLLTSNERMSGYMAELQRRKKEPRIVSITGNNTPKARVSLSDLRMPLMWKDIDHFKNKGDYRRFAVFCLARIGTEIYDTTLLCPVDRSLTDITFPDVILYSHVPPDFECRLEIYSHELQDDLSIASTPRKIKKTIHSSISRTVGKKLGANLRDELTTGNIGPHFELMASATLSLIDSHDAVHTHDLDISQNDKCNSKLPLFGHFCARLAVRPECITQSVMSGEFQIQYKSSEQLQQAWGNLQAFRLDVYTGQDQCDNDERPMVSIPMDKDTILKASVTNPKDIRIVNIIDSHEESCIIRLRSRDECLRWVATLRQHSNEQVLWGPAGQGEPMYIPAQDNRMTFKSGRQGSLYDEIPILESTTHSTRASYRPTVQDVFGLTPSASLNSCSSSVETVPFRERSYSTTRSTNSTNSNCTSSSTNSSKSSTSEHSNNYNGSKNATTTKPKSTIRSHWPFSNKNHT